ncbi:LRR receptor-like serine threonine-protein kinase [Seminavis robusta]|uniref:LRR receptor-like serine threonine-protein kinase n=1 Tax=Seminavis robusta TaxID=568900 RepID=A0A9N8D7H5_9STRA|nr:LRR receptor-like serine threonine-protein kinase [Seminavis robusta]|eukprot:Sro7_g005810.1 LRR receptor-like serine threonine-protein kinase (841) ;mRNA; f:42789-45545
MEESQELEPELEPEPKAKPKAHALVPPSADEWLEALGMGDSSDDDGDEEGNPISIYKEHMLAVQRKLNEDEKSQKKVPKDTNTNNDDPKSKSKELTEESQQFSAELCDPDVSYNNNPLDAWQVIESAALDDIEPLPLQRSVARPLPSQVGAYDESGNGEQIQRRKVSFQLFSSSSYNPQPLRVSSTANTTSELTAEVRRSDISLNEEEEKSTFKTNAIVTAIGCLLIVVLAIIVLAVVLQPDDDSSLEEVDWELLLLSSLDTPTQLLIEQEPASIQAQAYNWVIQDPDFDEMPPWRHLQRFALATIYYSTQGPQWNQPHDWLSYNSSECHWRPPSPFSQQNGTRNPTAYVEEEDPDHCNLDGVFDMLHLDGIDNFGGSFPSEIKVLTGLKEIHIINIPAQLSLSDFTPPQLAALTKLTSLDFTASNLENSNIPPLIGTFSSLKSILLSTAQIAGTLPTEIGLLENLDTLDVSVNRLGWFLPTEWSQLTNLARLYLQSNNLIGELPKEWGNLSSLRELDISDNQLTGNIPMEWEGMVSLTEFALYQNEDLVGETPHSFCTVQEEFHQKSDCEKVPCLRYNSSCFVTARWLAKLVSGPQLDPTAYVEEEDPDHCNLGGAFDMLHLDGIDHFAGSLPSEIEFLTSLKEIHIINIPAKLSLSDYTPTQLAASTKLTSLDFTASNLENSNIPTLIGTFSSLKSILLSTAQIAGTLPTETGLLENVDTLDVSVNELGWFLPTEWSQLTNLRYLYLESNTLIGELPKEWGNLSSLLNLDISDNQLTGTIPMEWEGMRSLINFALDQNEDLAGETPFSFCDVQKKYHQKSDCEKVPCCSPASSQCTCV